MATLKTLIILLVLGILVGACSLTSSPDSDNTEREEQLDPPTARPTQTPTETEPPLVTNTLAPTDLPLPTRFVTATPTRIPAGPTAIPTPEDGSASNITVVPGSMGDIIMTVPGGDDSDIDVGSVGGNTGVVGDLTLPQENQQVYTLNVNGGNVNGGGLNLLGVAVHHFAQNPANTNRYTVIDQAGMLYITEPGGANAFRIEQGPYTQFPAESRETNNAAAELAVWSPDGQYVAFIVNGDQQAADGVWYFQPGAFAPLQLLVDCPFEGFIGCNIVTPPDTIRFWESQEIYWSPDNQRLLVNANLPQQGRRGLMVAAITRNERVRDQRPPLIFYDYGTWGLSGRILASGRNPDGRPTVDWLTAEGVYIEQAFASGLSGLWLGWAVQRPDGGILALGHPISDIGPVAIYQDGVALTVPIGDSFPQRVAWSLDRSAVLIQTATQTLVARIDGTVQAIDPQIGGLAVNWVRD